MIPNPFKGLWLFLLGGIAISCATYYQLNQEFNDQFEQGNMEAAHHLLEAKKKLANDKNRFLYFANQGVVNAQLGNYAESNEWFEQAYLYGEDFRKNYASIATSFLVNPNAVPYQGEDHEHLLLLYYKAINFLKLGDYDAALVECRRLNNRLNGLSDMYKSDNKYSRDAFIHNLMGIIYEAAGDVNNAFIAYRNSYNIYSEDYAALFEVEAPEQLKQDLLRTAYLNGFDTDLDFYERKFETRYVKEERNAELVFFWHNGLGPVKSEWSINFTVLEGQGGMVTFANDEYGFNFPFPVADDNERTELTDLRFFRVAFPKYTERETVFTSGFLSRKDQTYPLEMTENVNHIAFKVLNERMLQEFGRGLLRVAIKKSIEMSIRGTKSSDEDKTEKEKQQEELRESLSFLVGAINAATEKADTRNWQTIPHSIFYSRVPLDTGINEVVLKVSSDKVRASDTQTFTFHARKGETIFHTFHSVEAM